jgi:hypothetical protein
MDEGPYTKADYRRAITVAALLGWTGVTLTELLKATGAIVFLPLFALIGLPIAFLSVWLIGGPVIRRVMLNPVGWLKAASAGTLVAAIIAAISVVIGRLNGLRAYYDPNFHFQIGGGDHVREVDGMLTLYGWQVLAQNTVIFISFGAGVGLIVRWVIGPGRT